MRDLVLLLGMQGAGKGTVGRLLAEDSGVTHLSAGSLLREHARVGGQHAAEILAHIDGGKPVDPSISYGLLGERAREIGSDQLLLLDAYPREASQLNLLEETVHMRPALVVHLIVPRPVAIERLRERETCEDCDATFGPDLPPVPRAPATNAPGSSHNARTTPRLPLARDSTAGLAMAHRCSHGLTRSRLVSTSTRPVTSRASWMTSRDPCPNRPN